MFFNKISLCYLVSKVELFLNSIENSSHFKLLFYFDTLIQNINGLIFLLQSLKSRGFVKEQFAWRHFYWYLTNEGIAYLRAYLHLPPEIVPSTLKRQARSETARPRPTTGGRSEMSRPAEDRAGYRRGPGGAGDKKADVGAGTGDLEFRGGFGRGKAPQ